MSVMSGSERGQMLLWKLRAVTLLALLWCGSSHDSTALSAGLYSWFLHTTGCLYILSPDSTHSIQLIDWTEGAPGRTAVRFVAFSDKKSPQTVNFTEFLYRCQTWRSSWFSSSPFSLVRDFSSIIFDQEVFMIFTNNSEWEMLLPHFS